MVKGISKRAVVVRPQGEQLFEQAIFIVAEGAMGVMSQQDMLREATRIAGGYAPKKTTKRALMPPLIFAAGMAATGIVWMITALIF